LSIEFFENKSNEYVLFSGTSFEKEQGVFRHLNDLFFILHLLYYKNIEPENITLVIDIDALDYLDKKTLDKKVMLVDSTEYTYSDIIRQLAKNIIDVSEFELTYKRNESKNLFFFSSGHGNIHGLSIGKNKTYLSPDYFEKNYIKGKVTFLYLSQCIAGAFHHLDTRKDICVLGASEYQTSVSIPIKKLQMQMMRDHNKIVELFAFYDNIPINPFIFSFFINIILTKNFRREQKNLLNLYKYINSSTIELIKNDRMKMFINVEKIENDILKVEIPYKNIQQPFLLNKILATKIIIEK